MKKGSHESRKALASTSLLLITSVCALVTLYLDIKAQPAEAKTPPESLMAATPVPVLAPLRPRQTANSDLTDSNFDVLVEIRWIGFEEYAQRAGATYERKGKNLTITVNRPGKEQAMAERIGQWLGRGTCIRIYTPGKKLAGYSVAPQNPAYPWNRPPLF